MRTVSNPRPGQTTGSTEIASKDRTGLDDQEKQALDRLENESSNHHQSMIDASSLDWDDDGGGQA